MFNFFPLKIQCYYISCGINKSSILFCHCKYGDKETTLPLKIMRAWVQNSGVGGEVGSQSLGTTYLLQLSEASCKATRVRPIEGTLEVLGGLAVQGLSCSDRSNPGKRICRAR
jgi:hypothetical protein